MEHEVFVPFSAGTVRQALADPARVSRCIPGFQSDAEESPDAQGAPDGPLEVAGRLRLRIGGSTITYRGRLRITEQDGGDLAVEGEGAESRGSGSVKVALNIRLSSADGGSLLACTGTVRSEGRLAESGETAAATAGRRLLDRFAAELASGLESAPIGAGDPADDNQRVIPGIPSPDKPKGESAKGESAKGKPDAANESAKEPGKKSATGASTGDSAKGEADSAQQKSDSEREKGNGKEKGNGQGTGKSAAAGSEQPGTPSVFETDVPPPSLDPHSDMDDERASGDEDAAARALEDGLDDEFDDAIDGELGTDQPAEAAHARRTMIGRSAEEVDHAPPRGRYAPVPAPDSSVAGVSLRWAAPAAAAVLASAVVVSRILRRRR